MELFRKHTSPLHVIIAGLLFCIATADDWNTRTFRLCQDNSPAGLYVTPTSDPFTIQSSNYPYGSYANNSDCTLSIESRTEPVLLSFEYRVVNLEVAQDCAYDYLCIVGVKFCGNWSTGRIFKRILPPRSSSLVRFHTDSSVTLNGFYIIVTLQPVLPIQQVQGSGWSERTITYVNATYYPGMSYTDGCSGSLAVPNYVPQSTTHSTRTTTTARTIYSLCESSTPAVLRVTPTSESFIIQSPSYGYGSYPNNLDCTQTFASGAEPLLLSFEYREVNLQVAQDCVYDYLCVVGVKFCGNWSTGRIFKRILPPFSNSTVHFHTDVSVAGNGFYITVTPQQVVPIQQVQGSGWSERNITYINATYYPGMPYTDGCSRSLAGPNDSLNYNTDYIRTTTKAPKNTWTYTLCDLYTPSFLRVTPRSDSFIIQSPNYPYGSYANNSDCTLSIESGAEPVLLSFEYRVLNLQLARDCEYDYLCVVGVKFCGNWSTGRIFRRNLPPWSNSTVHFHTDSSVTLTGFEIIVTSQRDNTIQQVQGSGWSENSITYVQASYYPGLPYTDGCSQSPVTIQTYPLCHSNSPAGSRVTPTGNPFNIQIPDYLGGSYANNLDCTFIFESGAEPVLLSFEYRVFNLQVSEDCVYDYLCVVGVKFCGSWASGRIFKQLLPPRSSSTLRFHSDSSVTQEGFYITVTPQPVLPIQQVQGSGWSESSITYINATYYPGMPYTDGCSRSFEVPKIGPTYTTDYTRTTTTTTTTTAPTQQDTYYFCNNQQSNNYIDINSGSSPFLIRSSNYPGASYGDNMNCSLVIRSGAEPLVLSLRIKDFQVEYQESCFWDYLCVHGTKFCGAWINGYTFQYILPENSRFTAVFKTDESVNQRGFDIEFSQQLARRNQVVPQPTGEFASSNDTFSNTLETYHPGYLYSDRCVATSTAEPRTSNSPDFTAIPTSPDVPTTSNIPDSTAVPTSQDVPTTSNIPDSTAVPTSQDVPTTSNIPDSTAVPTSPDVPTTSNIPDSTAVPTSPDVPTTSNIPDSTAVPTSPDVPTTSNIPDSTAVPTSPDVPTMSNVPDSTAVSPSNGNFCYSAAQVQQLNEIIDNTIARLNAARELLLPRN